MKKAILVEIICALFIFLFIYTGLSKILGHRDFVLDLGKDPMIGKKIAIFISIVLPIAEISVAAILFFPRTQEYGLWMVLALMVSFTTYVRWMLHDPTRHCTCGGVIRQMTWRQHFWFNIFFTILAVVAIYIQRSVRQIHSSLVAQP